VTCPTCRFFQNYQRVGADLIGRAAALLTELPVELYAARWRVASRPGGDLRVARDFLERDLDILTERAAEYDGCLKVQAAGVWTLAASINLPTGGPMLRDPGAVRDLAGSLAEGLRVHLAELRARLPRARLLLQLDEPSLPAVLAGRIPTESGFGTIRVVEETTARDALAAIIKSTGVPVVVHCCSPGTPLRLFREAGAVGAALDLDTVTDLDELGEALDAGFGLIAGVVDPRGDLGTSAELAARIERLWRDLGFPRSDLAARVVPSPACGLVGISAAQARTVLTRCREAGRRLLSQ
jgi:hypothetical protein